MTVITSNVAAEVIEIIEAAVLAIGEQLTCDACSVVGTEDELNGPLVSLDCLEGKGARVCNECLHQHLSEVKRCPCTSYMDGWED